MGQARRVAIKRGDVYLVNFDPTVGSEIKKTRPALVIQNDVGNRYSPVTIVAAVTSFKGEKLYPTEVRLSLGRKSRKEDSIILLNQLRTVDTSRLIRKLAAVDAQTMRQVDAALLVSLGLLRS